MSNIRVAAAGLLPLISSSAALAADLFVPPPEEAPIPETFSWSGPYIGAHLGWGFGGDQSFPAGCVCGPA